MILLPTEEEYKEALKLGIIKSNVDRRIKCGWTIKKAISTPVTTTANVEKRKMLVLAQKNGISETTFSLRLKRGWSMEEAATIKPCKYGKLKVLAGNNGICESTFLKRIERGIDPFLAAIKPLDKRGRKKKKQIS